MLYLAIPAHNEAATIGVLLWRLRTVLAEFPREYEAVVYDDASTDSTLEILQSYSSVMPLTILRGERRLGYAGAVDALCRYASKQTRYPRRDAILLLQGDFTDPPALVPEFAKRFEGGADIVVGERTALRTAPKSVRRLIRATPWLLRFFVGVQGVHDLTSSYRLIRISVLRDLLRNVGDAPVCSGDATIANVDLLLKLVPLARRVEAIPVQPTWEVRLRDTRVVAMSDAMSLFRWGWRSRGRRAVPSTAPESTNEIPRPARGRNDRDSRNDSRNDSRGDNRYDQAEESAVATAEPARGPRRERNRPAGKPARPLRNTERTNDRTAERKVDRPAAKAVAPDESLSASLAEEAIEAESLIETPARRKRSRGRRGDKKRDESNAADATDAADSTDGIDTESSSEPIALDEVELSPALSDAVADAETEIDGVNKMRPARKKRRRRGGRGRNGNRIAGESTDSDAPTSEESSGSDFDDNAASEPDSDFGSQGAGEPEAGEETAGDGEARVRRRGRRGRRGGARRSRQRVEGGENGGGEYSNGGEGDHASPPSDQSAPPGGAE
ncbi:MAG: glycosyltransferase family 2 protein [Gemmatimonadaceae bacterium]